MKAIRIFFNSILSNLLLLGATVMISTGCSDDDEGAMAPAGPDDIATIASNDTQFSTLVAALDKAGLVSTFQAAGTFTVFAPTNDAFAEAGITSLDNLTGDDLTPILEYHVLGAEVGSGALASGPVTSLNGDFYVSVNTSGAYINGKTKIIGTDIDASNGIIHVLDRAIVPPSQDIIQIAIDAGFSKLAEALTEADLITTLQGSGPFTVFAPTDAAFEMLYTTLGVNGPAEIDDDLLNAVLTYHVVSGRVFSTDLPNVTDGVAATLQGADITFDLGTLQIDDAAVGNDNSQLDADNLDILGTNGVIHVIDKVLLPQ